MEAFSERPVRVAALICAAGAGVRAGADQPKQFRDLGGEAMLAAAARAFLDHPRIDQVTIAIGIGHEALYQAAVPPHSKLLPPAIGGATRQASVRAGLAALGG